MSEQVKYFNAVDSSCSDSRYNLFDIIESTIEDLDNATVELAPTGEWEYTIYEQVSATNKDPNSATGIVETGIVKVLSDYPEFVEHSITTTQVVHEPQE